MTTVKISPDAYREVFYALSKDASFSLPEKRIHTGDDLKFFKSTTAFARIQFLLAYISDCVSELEIPRSEEDLSNGIEGIITILKKLDSLIDEVAPITGPRRFGNLAYKTWYAKVEETIDPLISQLLEKKNVVQSAKIELAAYLMASLGSLQRLDFGTGHELSFLAFFGGCLFLGLLDSDTGASIEGKEILWIFTHYFQIIRKVVKKYTLEPAGSHGVWGLDDHFHLPYIIGSAQLKGVEERHESQDQRKHAARSTTKRPQDMSIYGMPRPSAVMNTQIVEDFKYRNMYFGAIAFIYDVSLTSWQILDSLLINVCSIGQTRSLFRTLASLIRHLRCPIMG